MLVVKVLVLALNLDLKYYLNLNPIQIQTSLKRTSIKNPNEKPTHLFYHNLKLYFCKWVDLVEELGES
jgi:hypothetical protein